MFWDCLKLLGAETYRFALARSFEYQACTRNTVAPIASQKAQKVSANRPTDRPLELFRRNLKNDTHMSIPS